LPGYSENIRVTSILGRFLEHDRIFYFHNNGAPETYIGSADWRTRNLTRRVELVTPVRTPALRQRLIEILDDALADNRQAWELDSEGHYRLRMPAEGEAERSFQKTLMRKALVRAGV
jgi:polyphosphate kinase